MEFESITVRLNKELHQRLVDLTAKTGRSKDFHFTRAVAQYLEDIEDTTLVVDRIRNSEERVSMEEAKKMLDLN